MTRVPSITVYCTADQRERIRRAQYLGKARSISDAIHKAIEIWLKKLEKETK